MRRTMRQHAGWVNRRQLAAVDGVTTTVPTLKGLIGIIYLSRRHLGVGLVAHELTHAALRYCERVHVKVRHWEWRLQRPNLTATTTTTVPSEEFLCSVVEHLNRQFWMRAYRAGVVKP